MAAEVWPRGRTGNVVRFPDPSRVGGLQGAVVIANAAYGREPQRCCRHGYGDPTNISPKSNQIREGNI